MLSLSLSLSALRTANGSPQIAILSGGGYAGSLYAATSNSGSAGQWRADGVPIAGATGTSWTMTTEHEGRAITYVDSTGTSSPIEMWMPTDLPAEYRLNGGWWDPKRGVTVASGRVTAIADQFGVRPMVQGTFANQPDYAATLPDGGPAMVWPDSANNRFLAPGEAFSPAYWIIVVRYRNGIISTFPNESISPEGDYPVLVSSGGSPNRVMGERGTANLFGLSVWTGLASKNGASPSATVLPLPKSLLEFQGTPVSAVWSFGRSAGTTLNDPAMARAWRGPLYEVVATGAVPSNEVRHRLQAFLAWRNGLSSALELTNPYTAAGPLVT